MFGLVIFLQLIFLISSPVYVVNLAADTRLGGAKRTSKLRASISLTLRSTPRGSRRGCQRLRLLIAYTITRCSTGEYLFPEIKIGQTPTPLRLGKVHVVHDTNKGLVCSRAIINVDALIIIIKLLSNSLNLRDYCNSNVHVTVSIVITFGYSSKKKKKKKKKKTRIS